MKMFNSFNRAIAMTLVLSTVLMNVSSVRCMDQDVMTRTVFPKTFIGFCSWTGLSAGTFVGKKVYNKWSNIYPENKDHYAKIARRFKITSRIAAIPLMSFSAAVLASIACMPFGEKCPAALWNVAPILAMPGMAMTFIPAVLTTPELYPFENVSDNK
jgi:hypothetical protein